MSSAVLREKFKAIQSPDIKNALLRLNINHLYKNIREQIGSSEMLPFLYPSPSSALVINKEKIRYV